jgi:hypothetical protein
MGFQWEKLRLLERAFHMRPPTFASFGPGDIRVITNHVAWQGALDEISETFRFRPHFGWSGAIEADSAMPEPIRSPARAEPVAQP